VGKGFEKVPIRVVLASSISLIEERTLGLDQFLTQELYVKHWDHKEKNYKMTLTDPDGKIVDCRNASEVSFEVGYWRKANCIHKWFVDNVQEGVDDCGKYYVTREQLTELRELCQKVLDTVETIQGDVKTGVRYDQNGRTQLTQPGELVAQKAICEKLLPNQSGFFFGGTDYDNFYLDDLRHTIEIIDGVGEGGSIYYSSSW